MCQRVGLRRFGVIALGYAVASAAAGVVMAGALHGMAGGSVGSFADMFAGWLMAGAVMTPVTFLLALPPAVSCILYAERHGVRSPIAHAIFGALAGVYLPALVTAYSFFTAPAGVWGLDYAMSYFGHIAALYLVPGVCGGLAYWAAVGRTTV